MCWYKTTETYSPPKEWKCQRKLTDWPCEDPPAKTASGGPCFWGMTKITDYVSADRPH